MANTQSTRIQTMVTFLELERKIQINALVHTVSKYCEVAEFFAQISQPENGVKYLKRALAKLMECDAPTQHYQLKLHLNLGIILPDIATTEEAMENMTKTKELYDKLSNMTESMKKKMFSWMGLKSEKQKESFFKCLQTIRLPMLSNNIEVYKKMNDREKWLEDGLLWLKYALKHDYLEISEKRNFWIESAAVYAILCLTFNNLHQMHYLLRAAKYVLGLPEPLATLNSVNVPDGKSAPAVILLPEGVDEVTLPTKDESELNDVGGMIVRFEELDIPDVDEEVFAKTCVEVLIESTDIRRVYAKAKDDFGEAQKMIDRLRLGKQLQAHVDSCLEQFEFVQRQYEFLKF